MIAQEIIEEIEKLPEPERTQLRFTCALSLPDLAILNLKHPDQEMVERSCLHFLGDAAQEWWAKRKKN